MRTLQVTDFSCIKDAKLELGKLTLIIGPQASGKSVLCKLSFFLIESAHSQYSSIIKLNSFEKFIEGVKERFVEWFPIAAWGTGQFKINLSAGKFSVQLTRGKWGGKVSDKFKIKFSDEFKVNYEDLLGQAEKLRRRAGHGVEISESIEFDFKFREIVTKSLKELMGRDHVEFQQFVPAGRSFFTSIGKAIAAFEQGRVLDPLILRFGRAYTSLRERSILFSEPTNPTARRHVEKTLFDLLGGKIERDGDREYMRTVDGRKIPLSAMSSGQQELLPLITVLPWVVRTGRDRLCYIEEPEAHLFPSAQSTLIETLVYAANSSPSAADLIMTTHSPYVVTKVNNLLKAGAVSRVLPELKRKALEAIIDKRSWLMARSVRAYAIKSGSLISILDADGLIDADYLDEVSGDLSKEFGKLLDLEESVG